jgi:hypothetical protein
MLGRGRYILVAGFGVSSAAGIGRSLINAQIAAPGDAPDFVEVGEAGIAMDDAMRRQRRVQLVG